MKTYAEPGMEGTYKISVDGEEVYDGVDCWLLSQTTITTQEQVTMKMIYTFWISKTDYKAQHYRYRIYSDDQLVMEQEGDPAEAPAGEPEPIDVSYSVGVETVTVPAGTFPGCTKVEVKNEFVSITWVHETVPIWGLVKSEMYLDEELQTSMELRSYG